MDPVVRIVAHQRCCYYLHRFKTIFNAGNGAGIHGKKIMETTVFIDLSVPRNVAMEVGALEHIHVYDVDALNLVIENTLSGEGPKFSWQSR